METLVVDRADGIVTVTMNRPEKKNAVNDVMFNELREIFREVADRIDDRVLVLTEAGGAFCSGADLTAGGGRGGGGGEQPHQLTRMRHVADVVLSLDWLAKPNIAKV